MRPGTFGNLLVAEMLIGLMFYQVCSNENFVGINRICVDKNGTICNRRPPEECRFVDLDQPAERQLPVTNPETLFHVTVLMNHLKSSQPKRYLKLEWSQASGSQLGPVFVRVSPLVNGGVSLDHVICMSDLGKEDKIVEPISGSALDKKNTRQSTIVPWLETMTSSLVEININTSQSVYLVQTPKYGRHSWILQAVSITVQDSIAYISLTPAMTNYQISYTLTLVCYEYIKDSQTQNTERRSLNILSSSVTRTKCSSSQEEIYLTYSRAPPDPIVYDMTHWVYKLVIDAQLLGSSQYQVQAEISLNTLLFGRSGKRDSMKSTASQRVISVNSTEDIFNRETITVAESSAPVLDKDYSTRITSSPDQGIVFFSVISVYPDSKTNTPGTEFASAARSLASSSEKIQNATEDNRNIILGVSTTTLVLILIAVVVIAVRHWKNKRKQDSPHSVKTSEKSDNKGREHLCVISDCRPTISNGRKSKFRSDCCTNRTSDTHSKDDVSDPLIHSCLASSKSLNQKHSTSHSFYSDNNFKDKEVSQGSGHNDSIKEPTFSNLLSSEYDLQRLRYDILLNGQKPSKQHYAEQNNVELEMLKSREDNTHLEAEDIKIPTNKEKNQNSVHRSYGLFSDENRSCHSATRDWRGPVLNLKEQNILGRELSDFKLCCIIEPEILAGDLQPWRMVSECMKINQTYEALTGSFADMSYLQSCGIPMDDECFSICESIAC